MFMLYLRAGRAKAALPGDGLRLRDEDQDLNGGAPGGVPWPLLHGQLPGDFLE